MSEIKNGIKNSELFIEYEKTKDSEIRNQIFEKYQYLAEIISRKYINKGVENEDIYQIACLGLIYAIDRYDISKGFEFSSFATPTILGEIKKYFRDKGWAIRVPRRIQEISKKINDLKNELSIKLDRVPTVKELSEFSGYEIEEVLEAMEAGKLFVSQSLNVNIDKDGESNEVELMDVISDENDVYGKFDNLDFLKKSFEQLNDLEKDIIKDRFYNNKSQSEIAKKLNISQMTVSRLEKKILEKLKSNMDK